MKSLLHKYKKYIYAVFLSIFIMFWGSAATSSVYWNRCIEDMTALNRANYCVKSRKIGFLFEFGATRVKSAFNYSETAISLVEIGERKKAMLYLDIAFSNLGLTNPDAPKRLDRLQKSTLARIIARLEMLEPDSPLRIAFYEKLSEFELE